jgi:hypothetical protein
MRRQAVLIDIDWMVRKGGQAYKEKRSVSILTKASF